MKEQLFRILDDLAFQEMTYNNDRLISMKLDYKPGRDITVRITKVSTVVVKNPVE